MLFWIVAAALTLIACLAILIPFSRPIEADDPEPRDVDVYRDQLAEVDRDAERGLIDPSQAELARAEIGRRMLKTAAAPAPAVARPSARGKVAGVAAVMSVLFVSWGVYALIGSPDLPGQPLHVRLAQNPANSSVEELIAQAERHLAANPDDVRGWEVLGPVYLRQGRFADARKAWENAIRIGGASAQREIGLGEAIAAEAGGLVTADARAAFERARALVAGDPKVGYFLATALAQEGKIEQAVEAWRALKATLPAESPWNGAVDEAIAAGSARLGEQAAPGPDAAAVAAAGEMSAEDRGAMIESMVAGLDQKLRDNPADPEGWKRLVRSYVVLGRIDDARDAIGRARTALAGDAAALRALADMETALQQEGGAPQ